MLGLVVGGIASGTGKTTLTIGLIGALKRRGLSVQPFKVGPDYIDPSHHAQAAGRPSRNLDSWMVPEPVLRELFVRAASRADAAIVEGVMGLFDGRTGGGEIGSTAHVAKLLGLPLLLVVDAAKAGRTVAATVLGCKALDPSLSIIGVVLNNVASERHAEIGREAIEGLAGVELLGWIPRDPELRQDERYLGLVPAAERRLPDALIARATMHVEQHIDLDRLLQLATVPEVSQPATGVFPVRDVPTRARIALAQDAAFNFYYQDSLDLLEAWGAELVPFSPLQDAGLPDDVDAVYLGGGFPELFAAELAANRSMLASVRAAAEAGLPLYGECGGLMYLQERLIDADGRPHQMARLLPGESTLVGKRLSLGYREARARRATLLAEPGQMVRGHEFHWSVANGPPPADLAAYDILGAADRLEGFAQGNVLASYLHVHLASDAALAPHVVEAVAAARAARLLASPPLTNGQVTRHEAATAGHGAHPESGHVPDPTRSQPEPFLRRYGLPPAEIEALSRRRIEARIGDRLPPNEPERGLVARLVYAAGDAELAGRIVLAGDPIEAAVNALIRRHGEGDRLASTPHPPPQPSTRAARGRGGADSRLPIRQSQRGLVLGQGGRLIVDVGMVAAGISRPPLEDLGTELTVAIQAPGIAELARQDGITRSAAGILALAGQFDGAVVAIGNAPTALLALLDLIAEGTVRPAVVVGMPVGFVAAEESKELLLEAGLPCIVVRGTRGGSALAAAAVNYLVRLALERASARPSQQATT